MTDQAPAGWFPDPELPDQLRYWDGAQWTDHRAPKPAAQPVVPAPPVADPNTAAPLAGTPGGQVPGKKLAMKWKVGAGVLAGLIVIGALAPDEDPKVEETSTQFVDSSDSSTADSADSEDSGETMEEPAADEASESAAPSPTPTPKPKPKPASPYDQRPKDQTRFLAAVTKAQDDGAEADDDLHMGAALSKRNETVCSIVGHDKVRNWVGEVSELDANGEGKAIVDIELADDVHVATWNNFLSDAGDHTLIDAGPLFDKVLELQEGDVVKFSGEFVPELGGPCVNDSRLTLYGKVTDPQFIFRFSDVAPAK